MSGRRLLFVTWDGPQLTYLKGLFLPILAGLSEQGNRPHVLQFSWGDSGGGGEACRARDIPYRRVQVNRRLGPAGALWSAVRGARHVDRAVRNWGIDLLLPRATLPALAVLRSRSARALPILFDSDGLPIDERVDFAGLDPLGATYRILRDVESQMVRRADRVLVRTEAGAAILRARAGAGSDPDKYDVVPNGRDPLAFAPTPERRDAHAQGPHLCYAGSLGAQYEPGAMLALACAMKEQLPALRLSLFTGDRDVAERHLAEAGLTGADWVNLERLAPADVPARMAQCDIGLALRRPSFSMAGVAPIKIGEYLLAGLPILGTPGIGDTAEAEAAGVFLPVAGAADAGRAAGWWREQIFPRHDAMRETCRTIGKERFGLPRTIELYHQAIRKL